MQLAASDRRFFSRVMLALAPVALLFGWGFLRAGTGAALLGTGLLMEAIGVVLWPSGRTLALAGAGVVLGGAPGIFIVLWFLAGGG